MDILGWLAGATFGLAMSFSTHSDFLTALLFGLSGSALGWLIGKAAEGQS